MKTRQESELDFYPEHAKKLPCKHYYNKFSTNEIV